MPHDARRDRSDILATHVHLPAQNRVRFRCEDEIHRGARTCAPREPLLAEVERLLALCARRGDDLLRISQHMLRDRHAAHGALEVENVIAAENLPHGCGLAAGPAPHDFEFLLRARVVHVNHEHEAVELRLRQRIGALLLDGILRRKHEERLG